MERAILAAIMAIPYLPGLLQAQVAQKTAEQFDTIIAPVLARLFMRRKKSD